tara:strand:+ start:210 stop:410 length:201 start_codon:yes stop_codon:yes gene_type:complete
MSEEMQEEVQEPAFPAGIRTDVVLNMLANINQALTGISGSINETISQILQAGNQELEQGESNEESV